MPPIEIPRAGPEQHVTHPRLQHVLNFVGTRANSRHPVRRTWTTRTRDDRGHVDVADCRSLSFVLFFNCTSTCAESCFNGTRCMTTHPRLF